ncbi:MULTISPECIES: hypothetical protein [Streptomyces]|uniref:Transposase n=1 Tax=Streptomyces celluloflavus TaxID=58344 RepID=A0ABW7RFM0_9ACTN|nr:hypothetical protein [Streptomyces kasugaensis]WSK16427.1 hypothetical protein OG717_34610 [Streptomyces celluloflavus]
MPATPVVAGTVTRRKRKAHGNGIHRVRSSIDRCLLIQRMRIPAGPTDRSDHTKPREGFPGDC